MLNISFDASAYSASLTSAITAWKGSDKADGKVARNAVAAIVTGALTDTAIALTFYDAIKPVTGKGKACEPNLNDDGSVKSVRNLEQADIAGSHGARNALESILYVANAYGLSADVRKAIDAFIIGERKAMKLNPLKAFIKAERLALARDAAKDAGADGATNETDEADAGEEASADIGDTLASVLASLRGIDALGDASQRVALIAIAAEIDRLNAVDAVELEQAA